MSYKERLRKINKEEYKKRKTKKNKLKNEKLAREISRNNRNSIRSSIIPYYQKFKKSNYIHLLLILKETDNMEKIILQKLDLQNDNYLLSLPLISYDEMKNIASLSGNDSLSESALTNYIQSKFQITITSIEKHLDSDIVVIICTLSGNVGKNFFITNVRPYNNASWYRNNFTTIDGDKIYTGQAIKNFFQIEENTSHMYILQDTITKILLYRTFCNKMDKEEFLEDHSIMAKKAAFSKSFIQLYLVMSRFNDNNDERLYYEDEETKTLNKRNTN